MDKRAIVHWASTKDPGYTLVLFSMDTPWLPKVLAPQLHMTNVCFKARSRHCVRQKQPQRRSKNLKTRRTRAQESLCSLCPNVGIVGGMSDLASREALLMCMNGLEQMEHGKSWCQKCQATMQLLCRQGCLLFHQRFTDRLAAVNKQALRQCFILWQCLFQSHHCNIRLSHQSK